MSLTRVAYGYTNLTGLVFGNLTIKGNGIVVNKNRKVPVSCSCGTDKEIWFQSIVRGVTTSCGCVAAEKASQRMHRLGSAYRKHLPNGVSAQNALLSQYKHVARKRNYAWALPNALFFKLTTSCCNYCGLKPSNVIDPGYCTGSYTYSGIDRKDNSLGYTADNCVSCCKTCNVAKNEMNLAEFTTWIKQVYLTVVCK